MTDLPTRIRVRGRRLPVVEGTARQSWFYIGGLLALVPTVAILLVRVGINAPVGPRLPYGALFDPVSTLALLGPAAGALVLSLVTEDGYRRVALAFAGVFGLLSAVATPAMAPASVAVVGGTALIVVSYADGTKSADAVARIVVGLAFLAGIALSMAGGLGLEPATTRRLGSTVGLLAIAASPTIVPWTRPSLLVGLLAGAAVAGIGFAAPFVTGAASLIGGAIVGVSLPVMVLAVVGGVTVVATGVDRRSLPTAIGGLLVLTAGIPATVPRGLAVLVGLTLLFRTGVRP